MKWIYKQLLTWTNVWMQKTIGNIQCPSGFMVSVTQGDTSGHSCFFDHGSVCPQIIFWVVHCPRSHTLIVCTHYRECSLPGPSGYSSLPLKHRDLRYSKVLWWWPFLLSWEYLSSFNFLFVVWCWDRLSGFIQKNAFCFPWVIIADFLSVWHKSCDLR